VPCAPILPGPAWRFRGRQVTCPRAPSATTSGLSAIALASACSSHCSCRGCTYPCLPEGSRLGSHPGSAGNGEQRSWPPIPQDAVVLTHPLIRDFPRARQPSAQHAEAGVRQPGGTIPRGSAPGRELAGAVSARRSMTSADRDAVSQPGHRPGNRSIPARSNPARPQRRHPPGHLARARERGSGEFIIWQCDRITIIRAQHATGRHHGRAEAASMGAQADLKGRPGDQTRDRGSAAGPDPSTSLCRPGCTGDKIADALRAPRCAPHGNGQPYAKACHPRRRLRAGLSPGAGSGRPDLAAACAVGVGARSAVIRRSCSGRRRSAARPESGCGRRSPTGAG
jgi:hypothetical protein